MGLFKGTHRNKLDAKLRVSVPAEFRQILAEHGGLVTLRPSHLGAFIECWAEPVFRRVVQSLEELEIFSERQASLSITLFADAADRLPDKEGRIILPEDHIAHAGLIDSVLFIGAGSSFQIWEPQAGLAHVRDLRERARAAGMTLPAITSAMAAA